MAHVVAVDALGQRTELALPCETLLDLDLALPVVYGGVAGYQELFINEPDPNVPLGVTQRLVLANRAPEPVPEGHRITACTLNLPLWDVVHKVPGRYHTHTALAHQTRIPSVTFPDTTTHLRGLVGNVQSYLHRFVSRGPSMLYPWISDTVSLPNMTRQSDGALYGHDEGISIIPIPHDVVTTVAPVRPPASTDTFTLVIRPDATTLVLAQELGTLDGKLLEITHDAHVRFDGVTRDELVPADTREVQLYVTPGLLVMWCDGVRVSVIQTDSNDFVPGRVNTPYEIPHDDIDVEGQCPLRSAVRRRWAWARGRSPCRKPWNA